MESASMTAFGPTPIDPRGVQAGLAAAHGVRVHDRSKPTTDEGQRTRDAAQRRVAGAESESAVRRTADEHADEDSESHRDRRDGRRDEFRHELASEEGHPVADTAPLPVPSPTPAPRRADLPPAGDSKPHIDVRG
jgi:hypothetical protein